MKRNSLYPFLFLICLFFMISQCKRNPCSLSDETLNNIAKLDSVRKVPEFRERMKLWDRGSYDESPIDSTGNEAYRFIKSPPFNNSEIYRIEKRDGGYYATYKECEVSESPIVYFDEWELSEERWNSIMQHLEIKGFWTYFYEEKRRFLDPETWRLEAYKPIKDKCTFQNYHLISQVPTNDNAFVQICKVFMELKNDTNNHIEIYRSTDDSFQKDFFLRIIHEDVDVYGWEILEEEDTIYYHSKSKLEFDNLGIMKIRLKEYKLSRKKVTEDSLGYFEEDYDLSTKNAGLPFLFLHYNFFNGSLFEEGIKFHAIKKRAVYKTDEFTFERIK